MALLDHNAFVSTTEGITGVVKLTGQRAMIGTPSPLEQARLGGIVQYKVLLDPKADILVGDFLTIDSWGENVVDPTTPHFVEEAEPSGGGGLEVKRCFVSKRKTR